MSKRIFGLILTFLLGVSQSFSQNFNYFQQEVNYTIRVELDDVNHVLTGHETFEYHNNSDAHLNFLYIHLWPNAYKNGKTALAKQSARLGDYKLQYIDDKDKGYIDSLDFSVDGQTVKWELDPDNIDICKVYLTEPVHPGDKITVSTPFRVKIPSGSISRLGHVGESYQITQWYPKPAVYDNGGWHQMPYLGMGEFYSEFGTYDVEITLPENYVLGATGDRQNAKKEEDFLNEKIEFTNAVLKDPKSPQFQSIMDNSFPKSSEKSKTVRFYQENVHDFAWFADKRYLVLKGDVELPITGRKVNTWALFTPQELDLWSKSLEYLHDATYYYSLWNGEYPYDHVTAVDGTISAGGGMEYPNITVIGNSGTAKGLEVTIMHEVGHNWFYGILGSNERIHAWMDEGINSFNESRYMELKYPEMNVLSMFLGDNLVKEGKDALSYRDGDQLMYLISAKNYSDQPMQIHSDDYSNLNYGAIVYKKSAVVINYLMNYLGEDLFDQCMHAYFEKWKFKHPGPIDIRRVFEEETGKDLSWFFDELIKTNRKLDFKISGLKLLEDGSCAIRVKNVGELEGPFVLDVLSPESEIKSSIWNDPIKPRDEVTVMIKSVNKDDLIVIDNNENMPEFNRQNNRSETKGLLKKVEPISFKLGTRLDKGDETQMFWVPLYAWNAYDKNMIGLHLHNNTVPFKKFEYSLSPLFSLAKKDLNGFARVSYFGENADWHLRAQSFSEVENRILSQQYLKITPEVTFKLNSPVRSRKNRTLRLSSSYINKFYSINPDDEVLQESNETSYYFVNEARYSYNYDNISYNLDIAIRGQQVIEDWGNVLYPVSFSVDYNKKDKHGKEMLGLTVFGGKFLEYSNDSRFSWNSSGQHGVNDYEYDALYLGRSDTDGMLSRQITGNQGGLRKNPSFNSNNWMGSALVEYKVPVKLPIYVFAGAAYFDNKNETESVWDYDYSAGISLKTPVLSIHLPLAYRELFEESGKVQIIDAITFEFNLENINPNKLLRDNIK